MADNAGRKVDAFAEVAKFITQLYQTEGEIVYGGKSQGKDDLKLSARENGLTFIAHALQAANNAKKAGYEEEVQVAALLHDIGWLVPKGDDTLAADYSSDTKDDEEHQRKVHLAKHDKLGGAYLRELGFSERIATLVEGHVKAKRYLCFAREGYYSKLSSGSKFTLNYQGGPMTQIEAKAFQSDPDFDIMLEMRTWDEAAKVVGAELPSPFDSFASCEALIENCLRASAFLPLSEESAGRIVTEDRLKQFREQGYVVLKNWLSLTETKMLTSYVEQVASMEPGNLGPFHTYEQTNDQDHSKVLSRTEGFVECKHDHSAVGSFLAKGRLLSLVQRLWSGRGVVLYKDKINYKFKNGTGGYKPHQDAYFSLERGEDQKLKKVRMLHDAEASVCMIAVDKMTQQNGCPAVSPGSHKLGWLHYIPAHSDLKDIKQADKNAKESIEWRSLELEQGDVLIYGNLMPHKSGPNNSDMDRRALFTVYCDTEAVGEDARSKYYEYESMNRRMNQSEIITGKANAFFTGNAIMHDRASPKQQAA